MPNVEIRDITGLPVMSARCKTCPFNPSGCAAVRHNVVMNTLKGINQTCHSSGCAHGKVDTHLCRGARDYQLHLFHALGVLTAPTDEAWREAVEKYALHPNTLAPEGPDR